MKFKSGLTMKHNELQEHVDKLSKADVVKCLEIVVDGFPFFPNWLVHIERNRDAATHIKRLKGRKGARYLPEARRFLKEDIIRIWPAESRSFTSIGGGK